MSTKARQWAHKLVAAVITGGSTSALASVGIAVADAAGAEVRTLDLKQLGVLFVSGAVVGLLAYLKQSPLPEVDS